MIFFNDLLQLAEANPFDVIHELIEALLGLIEMGHGIHNIAVFTRGPGKNKGELATSGDKADAFIHLTTFLSNSPSQMSSVLSAWVPAIKCPGLTRQTPAGALQKFDKCQDFRDELHFGLHALDRFVQGQSDSENDAIGLF